MNRAEFINKIEKVLEIAPNTLTGNESLADIPSWDSLSLVSFIAMVHRTFGLKIPGRQIMECKTVNELVAVVGDRVA